MRTLKEQEYQVIALKYRAEATLAKVFGELGLGSWLTYGLLHVHWIVASMVGAYSLLGVYNLTRQWFVASNEYVKFKNDFDTMLSNGIEKHK